MYELNIITKQRYELVDITEEVRKVVVKSKIQNGQVLVFVPHSTCGILLTENEDGLKKDWLEFFKKLLKGFDFLHNRIDDNANSHLLSGFIGQEKVLPLIDGELCRGTWQNIFLAEFDGPRAREIIIQILENNKKGEKNGNRKKHC